MNRNRFNISNIKEIAARGTFFEPSLLPDSVNQTIIGLCDIVIQQSEEISELKQSISKACSECSLNKSALFKVNMQIQELDMKDEYQKLLTRISGIEETHRQFKQTVNESTKSFEHSIERIEQRSHDLEDDLRTEIKHLKPEVNLPPNAMKELDDNPIIIDSHLTDISPVVRGMYRNSRRIDGIDEHISSIRQENENVVAAVASAQENLQDFNLNLHDMGLSIIKYRSLDNERTRYFQSSCQSLEKQISDIWLYMNSINDTLHHNLSNTLQGIDEIQSILTRMSSIPLPPITNVSDVLIECTKIQEKIHEKKAQFDGEREHFTYPPEDRFLDPIIADVKVDSIKNNTKYTNLDEKYDFIKNQFDSTLLQMNVNELRIRVNELVRDSDSINAKFSELTKSTRQQIDDKVDSVTMERLFGKYQMLLDKMTQKIEKLDRKSTKKMSRIPLDYSEPIRPKEKKPHIDELPERSLTQQIKEKSKSTLSQRIYGVETPNPNRAMKASQRYTAIAKLASSNIKHNDFD